MTWHLIDDALAFAQRSRYLLLLVALLVLLVAYPFWPRGIVGLATFDIMLWGVLLAGLWALHCHDRLMGTATVLALVVVAANVAAYLLPSRETLLVSCLLDLALLVLVTQVVLAHVVEEGRIDADRIFGALCGYLLIGLTWALIYGALDLVSPGSFHQVLPPVADADAGSEAGSAELGPHFSDMDPMLYFSLVTLSTLGYGDIVATTRAARSLSALEAIIGQFYLAVVVGRLIGLHILARADEAGARKENK